MTTATATLAADHPALRYPHPDATPELVTIPAGTVVAIDDHETNSGEVSYHVSAMVGTFRAYATVQREHLDLVPRNAAGDRLYTRGVPCAARTRAGYPCRSFAVPLTNRCATHTAS